MEIISRKEAIEQGLKRYFTGKPCKQGHICEKWVCNYSCVDCVKIRHATKEKKEYWRLYYEQNKVAIGIKDKKRYAKNPEPAKARSRKYHKENKEKVSKKNRQYRINNIKQLKKYFKEYELTHKADKKAYDKIYNIKNRKKISLRGKEWRNANIEHCRQQDRQYYIENAEAIKESASLWAKQNRDKGREYWNRRRARKNNAEGTHTDSDIKWLINKQNYKCVYCHASLKKSYHVDHIIALSKGGDNSKLNLQILCPTCNLRKHAKNPIEFAQEIGLLL